MSICFKLGIVGRYCVTKCRNVISVSYISAVNLIVGWWLFACSMNCVTPSLFIPDRNNILRHTPATAFLPEAALLDR